MSDTSPLFIGRKLYDLESTDSTNAHASRLVNDERIPEGTVIRAKYQSNGKGYNGNVWESNLAQNILLSVILYPPFLDPRHQFFLNQVASLSVAQTINSFLKNKKVNIKWPNDVIIEDKKVAGILIENSIQGSVLKHSIVGIGMNVNQEVFEKNLSHASSMRIISGKPFNTDEVMKVLFAELEARYLQLRQNRIEQLQKDYMKNLYRVEEESLYAVAGKRFNAKIVGLTAEGKLILQTGDEHKVFGFKEVEMIF